MAENVLARDLMLESFATIRSDETLGAALRQLVALQDQASVPSAIAVLDADSMYQGLLTSRLLAKSLIALWRPEKPADADDVDLNQDLLNFAVDFLAHPVSAALEFEIPVVTSDARLLDVIAAGCEKCLEFVPVVDAGRIEGLIPVTAVFQATAALALTPDDTGIRFDQDG